MEICRLINYQRLSIPQKKKVKGGTQRWSSTRSSLVHTYLPNRVGVSGLHPALDPSMAIRMGSSAAGDFVSKLRSFNWTWAGVNCVDGDCGAEGGRGGCAHPFGGLRGMRLG